MIALVAILLLSGLAATGLLCWHAGRRYGRDEGWVDAVLQQARADRARRDKLGRFKAREVGS